ncbi:hypothetical protein Rsub_06171 [Raphidocelis subcapitata]|uniref:Dienelactone hydrolase domain-containing protein n=1 Tax=Raphidocelis subcapitata TaxID=307507 RepID=A0A2V0P4T3_9CHLO|nr:hypothetical protein Rsub_06171 [Raphidocelis subcapitata]|eukprot:GBF93922.1 hypothetical protein Rsub_06171 [Raphidocelis subcapitata]
MGRRRFLLDTPHADLEIESSGGLAARGGDARGAAVAVVLHPWGRLGGCMDDPTVAALYGAALASGLFSAVVRYNQRGAGRSRAKRAAPSSRSPDADDLVAVCGHALAAASSRSSNGGSGGGGGQGGSGGGGSGQGGSGGGGQGDGGPVAGGGAGSGAPPPRLALLCYSYGSCVAADALARLPAAAAYVSVGFPLGVLSRWFLGSAASWDALAAARVPKLLIMGTADNFTSQPQLRAAVARHDAAAGSAPVEVRILRDADHFFYERWEEVAAEALSWLAQQLGAPARAGSHAGAAQAAAAAAAEQLRENAPTGVV